MPASLRKQLEKKGLLNAVIEYAELYGQYYTMDRFGIRSSISFRNLLEEVTGNRDFGLNPKADLSGGRDIGEQIVLAIKRLALRHEKDKADWLVKERRYQERISFLELQLKSREDRNVSILGEVLKECSSG